MAPPRKTVEVKYVLDKVNKLLDTSSEGGERFAKFVNDQVNEGVPTDQIIRMVLINILESVLFKTNSYKGFHFTDGTQGETDRTVRKYYSA